VIKKRINYKNENDFPENSLFFKEDMVKIIKIFGKKRGSK
jgi:hypothetical protein